MNQRTNAFTLIELLAVIIILAAIALIIAPLVLDMIKEQQMKTFKESINGILRSGRLEIVNSGLSFPATFTYSDGKLISPTGKELKVTGKIPNGTGSLTYTSEDDITLGITDQTWCGTYNKISKEVEVNEFTGECSGRIEYNLTSGDPMYECFTFESSTGTLTAYTCEQTDIVIPTKIDGYQVLNISDNFNNRYTPINLTSVDFSKAYYLQTIGDEAFEENYLTTVIIPESVTTIGDTAFSSNKLTSVDFSKAINLTTIGDSVFCGNKLTSVDFSKAANLTTIGRSAFDSNSLTNVDLSNLINLTTIGYGAFKNNQLTNVTFGSINKLEIIESMAFCNTNSPRVPSYDAIPNSVTENNGFECEF